MSEAFQKRTITVNGEEVTMDVRVDLFVGDLSGDMDKVAAQMGFWGNVWAAAIQERDDADAHYRAWRARTTGEILKADPKLAEWKVKSKIEAHPNFLKYKHATAIAEGNVIQCKATFESLDKKSNQLQSKGAMSRSELDATGMTTPEKPRRRRKTKKRRDIPDSKHAPKEGDPRVSAMRGMFGKD